MSLVVILAAVVALLQGPDGGGSVPDSGPVSTVAAEGIAEGYGSKSPIVTFDQLHRLYPNVVLSAVGMRYDGIARAYLVISPASQTGPLPLVVDLAGSTASPTFEASRNDIGQLASEGKAVVVYPAQHDDSWNVDAKGCCDRAGVAGIDDVGFVSAVVAKAEATLPVSPGVHLVGYSNGGKLGFTLVCRYPSEYASLSAVAAVPLQPCSNSVQPALPVQFVIGGKDTELPINGKSIPALTALAGALTTWRARDGCTDQSKAALAGPVKLTTWTTCTGGTTVQSAVNPTLDHEWPTASVVGQQASGLALVSRFLGL